MILEVLLIPVLWVLVNIIHELGHYLYADIVLHAKTEIQIWWYKLTIKGKVIRIPSMITITDNNSGLFYLMGGLLASISSVFISMYFDFNSLLFHTCICIALIQLTYGIFEYLFIKRLPKDLYMKLHYILYLCVGVVYITFLLFFR